MIPIETLTNDMTPEQLIAELQQAEAPFRTFDSTHGEAYIFQYEVCIFPIAQKLTNEQIQKAEPFLMAHRARKALENLQDEILIHKRWNSKYGSDDYRTGRLELAQEIQAILEGEK